MLFGFLDTQEHFYKFSIEPFLEWTSTLSAQHCWQQPMAVWDYTKCTWTVAHMSLRSENIHSFNLDGMNLNQQKHSLWFWTCSTHKRVNGCRVLSASAERIHLNDTSSVDLKPQSDRNRPAGVIRLLTVSSWRLNCSCQISSHPRSLSSSCSAATLSITASLQHIHRLIQVGNPRWGNSPDKNSNWEIPTLNFDLEHTQLYQLVGLKDILPPAVTPAV